MQGDFFSHYVYKVYLTKMTNICRFYSRPFLIVIILNALLYFFVGSYLENYEPICSSFIQGLYTKPSTRMWNLDFQFLLFSAYSYINTFFPTIQVYGIVMFTYNFLILTATGLVLYRILNVNLKQKNLILFLLFYLVLATDNFLNIYTNRIAFLLFVTSIGFIESRRIEGKKNGVSFWLLFMFIFIFNCLLRSEIVLLCSAIYILTLLLTRQFYKFSLLPLLSGLFFFITINVVISQLSEARQVFAYKEKDFFDRDNVDYDKLTDLQLLQVKLFKEFQVTDKVHFTLGFYNAISYHNIESYSGNKILRSYLNGFNLRLIRNTFNCSYTNISITRPFIIFCFLAGLLFIYSTRSKHKKTWIIHFIFCMLYPLIICLYILMPVGFLIPYYSFLGMFYTLVYLRYGGKNEYIMVLYLGMLAFVLFNAKKQQNDYQFSFANFKETLQHIEALDHKQGKDKPPVVLATGKYNSYLSVNPFYTMKRQHVLLLNAYLLNSYDSYLDSWKEKCHCDPLSLYEKINYIVSSGSLVVIDEETFEAIQKYLNIVYQRKLVRKEIYNFDTHLKASKFLFVL